MTRVQAIKYIRSIALRLNNSTYHCRCSVLLLHLMTVNDTHRHIL